jgi:hypothetical protein
LVTYSQEEESGRDRDNTAKRRNIPICMRSQQHAAARTTIRSKDTRGYTSKRRETHAIRLVIH